MMYISEVIIMLEKNRQKKERAARRQTFVGVRPARFKKKLHMIARCRRTILAPKSMEIRTSRSEMGGFNFA